MKKAPTNHEILKEYTSEETILKFEETQKNIEEYIQRMTDTAFSGILELLIPYMDNAKLNDEYDNAVLNAYLLVQSATANAFNEGVDAGIELERAFNGQPSKLTEKS